MRPIRATLISLVVLAASTDAAGQTLTVTSNGSTSLPVVIAWDDYAKRTFGDAWDMNERTDIGWLTWGADQPASNMTGKVVQGGHFRGTPPATGQNFFADPNFFLLDSWFAGASKLGKNGGQFPIDGSRYTMLVLKMKSASSVLAQPGTVDGGGTVHTFASLGNQIPVMNIFWSRDSISYHPELTPLGGAIGLGFNGVAEVGIAYSPGGDPIQKSMEGGRFVLHSMNLADLTSTSSYTHIKPRSDATGWLNFVGPSSPSGWGGRIDSLRIDPVNIAGLGEIDLDFARLLAPDPTNSTPLRLTWAGGSYSRYDVILSTRSDCDDDPATAGPQYTVVAYGQSSGFEFLPQTLPPGEYYLGLRDRLCGVSTGCDTFTVGLQSAAVRACSAAPFRVVDAPTLTFTSPRPEGSVDEFATTHLNNPWDFLSMADVDLAAGVSGGGITTIEAERPSGVSMGTVSAYTAASLPASAEVGNVGDPLLYPFYLAGRGKWSRIDTNKYRLLTFDVGVDRARDLNAGSIARVVWHVAGEGSNNPIYPLNQTSFGPSQNVTNDIIFRHMAKGTTTADATSARHVIDRIQADLQDHLMLPLEPDTNGSQSRTGWFNTCRVASGSTDPQTGLGGGLVNSCGLTTAITDPFGTSRAGVAAFRVDPHEFSAPTTFHITGVKLAAHERIGASFAISWTATNPNPSGTPHASDAAWTVRLYGVPAVSGSPMNPLTRTCSDPVTSVIGDVPLSAGGASWVNGQFSQQPPGGILSGSLVFVCAGLIPPGGSTPIEFALSQWPVVYDTAAQTMRPRLFLDKSALRFTAIRTPTTLTAITPAQTVTVTQVGSGSMPWTVEVRDTNGATVNYVQVSPSSGTGAGSFTVTVVPSDQLPHGFTGQSADIGVVIRVSSASAENSPQYVNMTLALYREGTIATARAFGQVDTPVHYTGSASNGDASPCATAGSTTTTADDCVSGSIAVTGWALDDIGVQAVQIYRQCTAAEAGASRSPCAPVAGHADQTPRVFIGTASFISGARPDVEAAFASYPNAHRAGWGFLVLTNMLPHIPSSAAAGGQGVFDLYVYAIDAEGLPTLLGRTTADATPTRIYANNTAAAAPFGAIDFPAQGETISGTYNNFGWVLTPPSGVGAEMDPGGSGMVVFVDGVPIGTPTYNLCRGPIAVNGMVPPGQLCDDDISNLFRAGGYRNLIAGRGAIGLLTINTTTLSNGLHSIAWGVTDSHGRSSGIGSRFITVLNGAADWAGDPTAAPDAPVGQEVGMRLRDLDGFGDVLGAFDARQGTALDRAFTRISGRALVLPEMARLELALPMPLSGARWDGYLVQHGRLLPLPPGTTLDPGTGSFIWQAVPGWIGTHDVLFVRENDTGIRERALVSVTFGPATTVPGQQR